MLFQQLFQGNQDIQSNLDIDTNEPKQEKIY